MDYNLKYPKIKEIFDTDIIFIRKYIGDTITLFNNEYDNAYNDFLAEYDIANDEIPGTMYRQIMSVHPELNFFGGFSPHLLKKTSLIALYSIFEELLKTFCELAQKNLNLKIEPKDLNGSDIEKYLKYLKKVVEIDFSKMDLEWKEINDYRHIRNCIVHNYVNINESKNRDVLNKIINSNKFLSLVEDTGELYINHEDYLYSFIDLIEKFIKNLINEFELKMPSR